jgi:hypothetical protein
VNSDGVLLRDLGHKLYDEHFTTACDVDYAFQDRWPSEMKILLPELTVHIPHGTEGTNWAGRQSPIMQRLKDSA